MTQPGDRDAELIRRIQAGEPGAFDALYERHKDWVVSVALRFCAGNRDDAFDVLQETFAYLFRRLPGFRLTSRFRSFLYPAVKHLALARKAAARRHAPLEEAPAREQISPEVRDLLRGLPPEQREVVWLRFVDGFSLEEIAETLDIPLGTVKSRLHAALHALRDRGEF